MNEKKKEHPAAGQCTPGSINHPDSGVKAEDFIYKMRSVLGGRWPWWKKKYKSNNPPAELLKKIVGASCLNKQNIVFFCISEFARQIIAEI